MSGQTALVTGASRGIGQSLALELADAGAFVICASSRPGGCDRTLASIIENGGQGISLSADLSDMQDVEQFANNALKMVKRKSGEIINIASIISCSGGVTVPAYTASKHAIVGLTRALANEWAKDNVQVNAIALGYIKTDNTQALQDNSERSTEILKRIPANRWGEAKDLVCAALVLASSTSNYVNGHILAVDGGFLAR